MKVKTTLSLLITLLMLGCGSNTNSTENKDSEKKKEKSTLNADPCQLAFEQLKNMADGPEVFMKPIFNYNDYREVKRDYPDLENYYQMHRDLQDGTMENNPARWGGRFNDRNPLLLLYAFDMENEDDMEKELEMVMKGYYSEVKEQLLNEGWIWSEIKFNDCELKWSYWYGEDGVYKYAEKQFQLPVMRVMTLYLNVDGESIPLEYIIIETNDGWKLLLPSSFYRYLGNW